MAMPGGQGQGQGASPAPAPAAMPMSGGQPRPNFAVPSPVQTTTPAQAQAQAQPQTQTQPSTASPQQGQGQGQAQGSPTKEVNTATLCRFGQEAVQEMLSKTMEMFRVLSITQLPSSDAASHQAYQDKKSKLEDQIKVMALNFKQLRAIYNQVRQKTASLESRPVEELLPVEENGEVVGERPKVTEAAKYASEEHKEVIEQICAKNQQLKDIIDQLRTIVWEINTMMAMTKATKVMKSPPAGSQ